MARPLRIEYENALYHIISRGNEGMTLFIQDQDRHAFMNVLERVVERYNWICHAYCLMGNHYHLVIETPDANLCRGMKYLNGVYSQKFNRRNSRFGHVLQGRYKSFLVQREEQFLENCRYIVLNPVRAKIVRTPSEWKWSSYNATRGVCRCPPFLDVAFLLSQFSSSQSEARAIYRNFILAGIGMDSPLKTVKHQIFLGSDSFVQEAREKVCPRDGLQNVSGIQKVAGSPGLPDLFRGEALYSKKIRNERILDAFDSYGYTLREIGEHLDLHPNYLSSLLGKMRKS